MCEMIRRMLLGIIWICVTGSLSAQSKRPPTPSGGADSVSALLVHYLEFRLGSGLSSPVVQFCDPLVTDEVLAAIRKRLDATTWLEVSRTASCDIRPVRLEDGDVNYVLVVGPIRFSAVGASIVASRWHLRMRQPEVATVGRHMWQTTALKIYGKLHSTSMPRQPPRD
jgi:hypothetical protein